MGATFVVTLREAFEAALLLGIVYTDLDKTGARAHAHYVTIGGALGLAASVGMGVALTYLSGPVLDVGPDLVATVVIFGAVALLTWHGGWMQRHASAARGGVGRRLDEARANQQLWVVGLIAFTGVFREGAETVLFLWGRLAEAAGGGSAGRGGGEDRGESPAARWVWSSPPCWAGRSSTADVTSASAPSSDSRPFC